MYISIQFAEYMFLFTPCMIIAFDLSQTKISKIQGCSKTAVAGRQVLMHNTNRATLLPDLEGGQSCQPH